MSKLKSSIQHLFAGKKILILGMGKEGFSTLNFLRKILPQQQFTIMDISEKTEFIQDSYASVTQLLGNESYLQNLDEFDVIFKTPSIPLSEEKLQRYIAAGGMITSQLNEFLRVYRDQTIGVTGTKGKSTTTAFIRHLFHLAGKNIVMAGNIGIPPFEIDDKLSEDCLIAMEMSSYQLESVHISPRWAIWLNVFHEHLNFHGTIDKYATAKANICLFQKADDYFIYNQSSPEIELFSKRTLSNKLGFAPFGKEEFTQYFSNTIPSSLLPEIFLFEDLPAILQLIEVFKIKKDYVSAALSSFQPLPHRLERIETKAGVIFVDDTLATIPEATVAAISSFTKIQIIMLGGYDRGIEYELVVDEVVKKKIPYIIFFKPSGEKMNALLQERYPETERPEVTFAETMEEAISFSFKHAKAGDIVLLSPASPSFGQYKDYQDKAAQFRSWITELDT